MKHRSANCYLRANGLSALHPKKVKPLSGSSRSVAIIATALVFSAAPNLRADLTKANNTHALNLVSSWTDGTLTPTSSDVLIWGATVIGANSVVTGAPLSAKGLSIVSPGGLVTITSDATNTLTLGASGIDMSSATQNLTLAGQGPILGGNQTWNVASGRTLTVSGAAMALGANVLTLSGDGDFSFSGTATGSAGLVKNGSGTLFFPNSNTAKNIGNISLNGGTFNYSHANSYSGTVVAANGTTITSNVGNGFVSISATGNISINSATTRYSAITGGANTLTFLTGTTFNRSASTLNGSTLDVRSGATFQTGADQNNGTSSSSTITKIGAGTWTLQNGQLSATTGITINAGALRNLSANRIADATAVTIDGATAVYDLQTFTETVGAVSLKNGGSITGTTTGALTGSSYAFESGSVSAILAGSGILTKTTSGTVTLSGLNTYNGATQVNGGRLSIDTTGTINNTSGVSIGAGEFSYNNSTTALSQAVSFSGTGGTLSGTGTITPAVIITSGNRQTAGTSVTTANPTATLGKETFGTSITYSTGSIFEWNLTGDTATTIGTRGTDYDALNTAVLGATSGAIFRVILNNSQNFGETFWDTDRTWAGIFRNIAENSAYDLSTVFNGGFEYQNSAGTVTGVTSTQGAFTFINGGTDLKWSAVPEPTSALAGLLIGAGLLRRRRA